MIQIAMTCPCGTHAVLTITGGDADHRWSCSCPQCYAPVEDSGARAHLIGYGVDPETAIAEWWERVELQWEIDYLPNTLLAELSEQAGGESERQELWSYSSEANDGTPRWFAPPGAEMQPIPVAWPEVSP